MTTERFQSLECVPRSARRDPRYVGDHVIRHYRPLGLADLLRDLGADPSTTSLTITGGIGCLTMHADGSEDWRPVARTESPPPRPSSPELADSRRAACQACDAWREARCSAAGCGCAGEGRPDVWSSRCPLGKWHPIH
jgi:hypothetical protein